MKAKRHIRRIFFLACWLAAGVGIMVLLVVAIRVQKDKVCKGYEIVITGSGEKKFIDEQYIIKLLTAAGTVKGKSIKSFDLRSIETQLEKTPWVRNAELYFDNNQVLKVSIEEKEPVARIFTVTGDSYYISRNGEYLPLSDRFSGRLPVFTGFPVVRSKMSRADSLLMLDIEHISDYLSNEPLWMAQIAQVHITRDRHFEMVPMLGNHIIEFGDGTDCEDKFRRLRLFYQQVLAKRGLDVYERIRLQFKGQVVGVRKGG